MKQMKAAFGEISLDVCCVRLRVNQTQTLTHGAPSGLHRLDLKPLFDSIFSKTQQSTWVVIGQYTLSWFEYNSVRSV